MKSLNKFLAASLVMACLSSATYAQSATDGTVKAFANIVAPITIDKTADFDFGWLSSSAGGTAILSAAGVVTPGSAAVSVVAGGTGATAASFDVTGEGTNLYTIVFPASVSLTGPGTAMSIASFTTAVATGTVGTLAAGAQTFTAGATLTIGAAQTPGAYASGVFDVTVSYN